MPETPPDPRGRIRKTVGRPRERTPLETVWMLREQRRALGLPPQLPTAHVRKTVGHARPR